MKYAPRKVYIKENGGYTELSYEDFCRRREADGTYKDKFFIPVQGCLIETEQTHYIEFYRDKERWRYLQKLDADNSLDLCQYFGQKKSKDYAAFFSSSSSFCCGVK